MISFIVLFIVVTFFVWASSDIRSRIYLHSLCRGKDSERGVALTFDDGPDPVQTPKILDLLKENQIKATFFLVGSKVEAHPELAIRIHKEGHLIGNHTYSHIGTYPLWSSKRILEDIMKTNEAVYRITGLQLKLFRPPFGVTNPLIRKAVKDRFVSIGWSIRSFDTVHRLTRDKVSSRIEKRLKGGDIILLHDRCEQSDILLQKVLKLIQEKGLRVVPLDQLLKVEAYEN